MEQTKKGVGGAFELKLEEVSGAFVFSFVTKRVILKPKKKLLEELLYPV